MLWLRDLQLNQAVPVGSKTANTQQRSNLGGGLGLRPSGGVNDHQSSPVREVLPGLLQALHLSVQITVRHDHICRIELARAGPLLSFDDFNSRRSQCFV